HDDRARHLWHADAVRHAPGGAGCARRERALPFAPRHAGRLRQTRQAHHRERHAQRRGDPTRRRDPAGAALTRPRAPSVSSSGITVPVRSRRSNCAITWAPKSTRVAAISKLSSTTIAVVSDPYTTFTCDSVAK